MEKNLFHCTSVISPKLLFNIVESLILQHVVHDIPDFNDDIVWKIVQEIGFNDPYLIYNF